MQRLAGLADGGEGAKRTLSKRGSPPRGRIARLLDWWFAKPPMQVCVAGGWVECLALGRRCVCPGWWFAKPPMQVGGCCSDIQPAGLSCSACQRATPALPAVARCISHAHVVQPLLPCCDCLTHLCPANHAAAAAAAARRRTTQEAGAQGTYHPVFAGRTAACLLRRVATSALAARMCSLMPACPACCPCTSTRQPPQASQHCCAQHLTLA